MKNFRILGLGNSKETTLDIALTDTEASGISVSVSVPFHKDIVLPALHPQKDLPKQGECWPMIGIDSDLRHRPAGEVIRRKIVCHADFHQLLAFSYAAFRIQQFAGWLQLAL